MDTEGNTLLIESNRKIAVSKLDDSFDDNSSATNPRNSLNQSKARWSTTLDSNILLREGDQISLEYAAMNIPGIGNEMIQFKGSVDTVDNDGVTRVDNETTVEFQFYITNRMEFNMAAPVGDAKLRRELYKATYGSISLDGRQFGNGAHKSGDGNYIGQAAGFEAFNAAYPYRAIPGVAWTHWNATLKRFEDPKIINTPLLSGAQWGSTATECYQERTPLAKGPYVTSAPSNDRMYACRTPGQESNDVYTPFMDFSTASEGGMEIKVFDNMTAWNPLQQDIKLSIREGNSTAARIGEILSTQLKNRNINDNPYGAYQWDPQRIVPGTYDWSPPISEPLAAGNKRQLTFTPTGVVCGKTYQTISSSTGYLCNRKYNNALHPGKLNNWSAEFDYESGDTDATSKGGLNYSTAEAYRALYNNLLCGNPREWITATSLLPGIQYFSTTTAEVLANGDKFLQPGSTNVMIPTMWTGENNVATDKRTTGTPDVHIGEFGNHPRINTKLTVKEVSVKALNPIGSRPPSGTSGKFQWSYRQQQNMRFTDIQDYEVVPTTMFMRGGATSSNSGYLFPDLDKRMEAQMGWFPFQSSDEEPIPSNRNDAYYSGAFVEWIFCRSDDELTFANATVDGVPGANVLLSNDYLTSLYLADPTNPLFNGTDSIIVEGNGGVNNGSYCIVPVKVDAQSGTATVDTICSCSFNFSHESLPGYKSLGYNNEAQQRKIKMFRYLPPPPSGKLPITAENLYNEKCDWLVGSDFGPLKKWRTRPPNLSFEIYKSSIFDPYMTFNDGKGSGCLPVFDWFHNSHAIRNEPFIATIAFKNHAQTQRNFPYPWPGEYMFLASPSFMQNKLAFPVTTQTTNPDYYLKPNNPNWTARTISNCHNSDVTKYANCVFCGANDPLIDFNNIFTRFAISKLHTAAFRGNGPFNRMDVEGGNADADAVIMSTDSRPAAISRKDRPESQAPLTPGATPVIQDVIFDPNQSNPDNQAYVNVFAFNDIEARVYPYTVLSAQGGVGIVGLRVMDTTGTKEKRITAWDYHNFAQTLLYKLGFRLNQLLPLSGQTDTQYNSFTHNNNFGIDYNIGLQYFNQVSPVTTNAYISSSEQPAFVIGFGNQALPDGDIDNTSMNLPLPAYNLGVNYRNSATQANSDEIIAFDLANKITFPYLVLYSNMQSSCGSQYIGSRSGQQKLDAISFLSVNYSVSDFAYTFRSDLIFTVTKEYLLSELISDVRFPNGDSAEAILGENSACIYRIDFAKRPIPLSVSEMVESGKELDKKDKMKAKKCIGDTCIDYEDYADMV